MTTGDSHNGSNSQHRLSDQVSANTLYYLSRLRATTPQPTALYSLRGRCDNSVAIRTEAEKLRPKMCSKLRTQPSGPGDYCHQDR
jgi:hypothetical protein